MSLFTRKGVVGIILILAWLGCSGESERSPGSEGQDSDLMRGFNAAPVFEMQDEIVMDKIGYPLKSVNNNVCDPDPDYELKR